MVIEEIGDRGLKIVDKGWWIEDDEDFR